MLMLILCSLALYYKTLNGTEQNRSHTNEELSTQRTSSSKNPHEMTTCRLMECTVLAILITLAIIKHSIMTLKDGQLTLPCPRSSQRCRIDFSFPHTGFVCTRCMADVLTTRRSRCFIPIHRPLHYVSREVYRPSAGCGVCLIRRIVCRTGVRG